MLNPEASQNLTLTLEDPTLNRSDRIASIYLTSPHLSAEQKLHHRQDPKELSIPLVTHNDLQLPESKTITSHHHSPPKHHSRYTTRASHSRLPRACSSHSYNKSISLKRRPKANMGPGSATWRRKKRNTTVDPDRHEPKPLSLKRLSEDVTRRDKVDRPRGAVGAR